MPEDKLVKFDDVFEFIEERNKRNAPKPIITSSDSAIHADSTHGLVNQDWKLFKEIVTRLVPATAPYKYAQDASKVLKAAQYFKKGVTRADLIRKFFVYSKALKSKLDQFSITDESGYMIQENVAIPFWFPYELSKLPEWQKIVLEKYHGKKIWDSIKKKPFRPKLPVRIRGLDELYKKIEPVKIDYDKYLIKPVEETVSSFINPIGSGLKGGFLKTMLSFLTDSVNVSLPLSKLGSSGLFKSMRGIFGMGGNNIISSLGMFLGGKDKLLGRLFGKGGLFGGLLGKGGLPGPGFDKMPACPFSCPLLSGSKGGRFPGLFDEKKDGQLASWMPSFAQMPGKDGGLEHLKTIREMYDKMFEQIIGGNDKIMASFDLMFRKMLEWATGSFDKIGQRSSILNKDLYGGLSSYAMHLGTVSGYASKAFAAFRTLNPFGAAAASFGLIALGQMLRSLSSGMGGGAGWGGGSGTRLATAGAGGSTAESTWRGPQVVNVYIDGIRSANVYQVDRSLDRAGVDRELRNRIRELVRTGSNPIREY